MKKDIRAIQNRWQTEWADKKTFEVQPEEKEKFFMTVPYPYISGSLHIGHARVVTEADVFTRFQRMTGKNTLYAIAFHISGTPVLGISLAIKNGDQKKIDLYKGYVRKYIEDEQEVERIVKTFEDPEKIVDFFIPKMKDEFKTLGLAVDWRRSYTSGDPEHQALVSWQFQTYREKDYVIQGKYPILYSLSLENAVGEDDIQEGDTNPVSIQDFTLIKFKLQDGSYLIASTLRPETMYGQTNMWVHPDVEYKKVKVEDETWVVSTECVTKLRHQGKDPEIIGSIRGSDLIGQTCHAPFVERDILILPLTHCDPEIATGIVTSVPSDAPFDWIGLKELQDDPSTLAQYGISADTIKNIKPIPIIDSKGFGPLPGVEICESMGITSLSQKDKLTEATQEVYKKGFHTGKLMDTCGPFAGMGVTEAKEKMRTQLIEDDRGDVFFETSRPAQSRDGGNIIVAILDNQWFIDFNAEGWKEKAYACLEKMEIIPDKYRKRFQDIFAWLDKRPCARKRGLGTKLPYDQDWVIESLSDSTIYMALYPINHLIRAQGMSRAQLVPAFFEYVMNKKGDAATVADACGISSEALQQMQDEWQYWYPFDHRHTFTAHLSNHLSFMIFAHTATFAQEHWPKRISFHGMITSEGEKMSKSKGNVITLVDINEEFGADAFRAFMCSSTSVESAFNWETDRMAAMKRHLDNLLNTLLEIQGNKSDNDCFKDLKSFTSKFERLLLSARNCIAEMDLRGYANVVLYEIMKLYKQVLPKVDTQQLASINNYIADRWTAALMPLVPHLAEEAWAVSHDTLVSDASWPKIYEGYIDESSEYEDAFVGQVVDDIRSVLDLVKIDDPKSAQLILAPQWKYTLIEMIKEAFENDELKGIFPKIMQTDLRKHGNEIKKIVPALIKNPARIPDVVLDPTAEKALLERYLAFISDATGISVILLEGADHPKARQAMPGKPAIVIE
ncbi:MAG: leucine--tRNA ligase [Nanoarchaeota archaeon]